MFSLSSCGLFSFLLFLINEYPSDYLFLFFHVHPQLLLVKQPVARSLSKSLRRLLIDLYPKCQLTCLLPFSLFVNCKVTFIFVAFIFCCCCCCSCCWCTPESSVCVDCPPKNAHPINRTDLHPVDKLYFIH